MKKQKSDVNENQDLGQPMDPTTAPQSFMGDTYGLTGITSDDASATTTPTDEKADQSTNLPSAFDAVVNQKLDRLKATETEEELFIFPIGGAGNDTLHAYTPPSIYGEQSVSGDMADPESDDDTLLNSHQMGLRLDEDYENPQPLDIARDVASAEAYRRGMGDSNFDAEDE